VVNYIRQVQNGNPSDEYLAYYGARVPQHKVRLAGMAYADIYFEPSPRPVRNSSFGDATLIAQTLDAQYAEPGKEHDLVLLWRTAAAAGKTLVRLQVRDSDGWVWSESEGPVLSPEGPSAVEGHYTLSVPTSIPRGDYQLWLTVGSEENWAPIGMVPVHQFAPPDTIPYPTEADFGGIIALHGFDTSDPAPIPGETLTLTFYWEALQPAPRSYTTFVHLLDLAGNRLAQSDVLPGDGEWTTDTWKAGEWIMDEVVLSLPSVLPAGEYRLLVGWYDWETGTRLPLAGTDDSFVELEALTIQ
jgi:hypothetical protein